MYSASYLKLLERWNEDNFVHTQINTYFNKVVSVDNPCPGKHIGYYKKGHLEFGAFTWQRYNHSHSRVSHRKHATLYIIKGDQ